MMKIIRSAAVLVASLAIVASGAYAWSLQTETITGTTFAAGSMDLKIDSDPAPGTQTWTDGFDYPNPFSSLKPGSSGSQIVDIQSQGDPNGVASIRFQLKNNKENTVLNPEVQAGDSTDASGDWGGELAQNLRVKVSYDANNDGAFDEVGLDYTLAEYHANPSQLNLGAITGANGIASVKIEWYVPADASNKIMTDSLAVDVIFGLE